MPLTMPPMIIPINVMLADVPMKNSTNNAPIDMIAVKNQPPNASPLLSEKFPAINEATNGAIR